ncbi:hypothetical protein AB0A74_05395 [Saccharothrix sp. NPDC042600]|uniref:hypothetical protein n=1 Tax=Saccharothrix TaxID=2071 RepID=UPI003407927D
MSAQASQPLCMCGPVTIVVLLLLIAIALVYGEVAARLAVRHQFPDRARHHALGFDKPCSSAVGEGGRAEQCRDGSS